MKPGYIIAAIAAVVVIAFGVFFIDVDQTEEAALPDVDVDVSGGNMPEFDVETGDVEVGSTEVTVPTIDIESPEEDNRTAQNDG